MARLFYVHWNKEEALETVRVLRAAGHAVQYHFDTAAEAWKLLRATPPDALLISLARLASHGREVARVATESKKLRALPLIFVGGEPEKVVRARQQFPAARFCAAEDLAAVLQDLPALASAARKAAEATKTNAVARPAGYSGTPLAQKLGIKADHHIALINAPDDFDGTLGVLPDSIVVQQNLKGDRPLDVIVFFAVERSRLIKAWPDLKARLSPAGGLWIAWPKKASGVATDLTEDVVRAAGLKTGLVDNKVCAVDETWSGLRFVVRLKDRPRR